jgi:hypothetical protein
MAKQQNQPFESTLQDLVYSLDAGTGLKLIRFLLFSLLMIGVAVIYTGRQFRGFDSEAAMDSAQLGRNLAEMNQYVTRTVRPITIAQVSAHTFDGDAKIAAHPELIRAPGYPAILAVAFKFFHFIGVDLFPDSEAFKDGGVLIYPAEQWVIVPINHLFTILTGLMLYLFGRNLFSVNIGFLAVLSYFLSAMVWEDGLHGTGIPVVSFFVISAFYFILLAMNARRERRSRLVWVPMFIVSGLFCAAAFMTHYAALVILPGIALFILIMGTKAQWSAHLAFFYLVLVGVLVAPWIMRNMEVSGMPLGLAPYTAMADSGKYPGDTFMRTLDPKLSLVSDANAMVAKWKTNFTEHYSGTLPVLGGGLMMVFFLVTYFYRFVRVHVHKLRWGIGLSMLLFFVGSCCYGEEGQRLYHIFWPFVLLYGLAFFSILLDRLDITVGLYKLGITILVVTLTALPLAFTVFFAPKPPWVFRPYHVPFVMRVSELLRPTEVMCTDMPWATAWYGKRISVLLPKTVEDFYEINDYGKYMSGVYFTTLTKDRPMVSGLMTGSEKSWFPITMGKLPENFPLRSGFQLNGQDQLFLTDNVRWGGEDEMRDAAEAPVAEEPTDAAAPEEQ